MVRLAPTLKVVLIVGLTTRFHHQFHGPAIDFVGLAAASFASWAGLPGPGEPVLIAAAVVAAKHKLGIGEVLVVAWAGATAGGIAGWLAGLKLGRTVLTAAGPIKRMRLATLRRGDEIFERFTVLAIVLTPAWIAGIHRVSTGIYMLVNLVTAIVWAVGIGVAAYFVGPAVVDFVDDLGWVSAAGLAVLIAAAGVIEVRRRRRREARRRALSTPPEQGSAPTG